MAKTLEELEIFVESKANEFYQYLSDLIPSPLMLTILSIAKETDVYLFSGVIRNYFLGIKDVRDIDLVLEKPKNINKYFPNSQIDKNEFGGYKVHYSNIPIDIWFANDTWAYKIQSVFNFDIGKYIFKTAYFNFSAIIYSFNEKKFYYSKHFLRFLQNKEIDIVFPINKNYDLCILNTIYYSENYKLKISKNLSNTIIGYYYGHSHEFEKIQLHHFGEIKYDLTTIDKYIKNLNI